jgi:hypothetical protein
MDDNTLKARLGRVIKIDERDKKFLISSLLPKELPGITYKYWWPSGWWGDQGYNPHCVAFSWVHWLAEGTITQKNRRIGGIAPFDTTYLYNEAQKIDEWEGECVDIDTECLTKNGWKKYDELNVGDKILTFDLETEKTSWMPLEKIHIYKNYNYTIWGHKGIEIGCTDNHKWPVHSRGSKKSKYEFVETKYWKSRHEIARSAPCQDLPIEKKWDDNIVSLIAWVITEGSYRPDYRRGNSIDITQKTYLNEVKILMESLNVANGYLKKDGSHVWSLNGELAKLVRNIAPNRVPKPDWLLELTQEQLELFINICIKGDGNIFPAKKNRKNIITISQKSGDILDSIIMALVLSGKSISRSRKNGGSNKNVETWTLRKSNFVEVRNLKKIQEKIGIVWCPQTENKTFIARRHKSIFITGNSYDGTSVRAGAKVLQNAGFISIYNWAWDLNTTINSILTLGPVVAGTWWTRDMFYPDKNGIISANGDKIGGHAYLLDGVNIERKIFRIKNSWGRNWGKNGFAYISFDDMEKLILDDGEICLATEMEVF